MKSESNGGQILSISSSSNASVATVSNATVSTPSNAVGSIQSIYSDDVDFQQYIQSQDTPVVKNAEVDLLEMMGRTSATVLVAGEKVYAGCLDLSEHLSDGLLWTGGKLLEGGSFAGAQIIGIFNPELKDTIMDGREILKQDVKDRIEEGQVGAIEELVFNTQMGKTINDASYLKYDSNVANGLEGIVTKGTEVGVATAATVLSGGTIVPIVIGLGFLDGTGEQAQKIYQNNDIVTGAQEASIALSGVAGAAEWYAYGRFGQEAANTFNRFGNLQGTPSEVLEEAHNLWNTRRGRVRNPVRNIPEYAGRSYNKIDMVGGFFESLSNSLSDSEVSVNQIAKDTGVDTLKNFALNVGFSGAEDIVSGLRSYQSFGKEVISCISASIRTLDAAEDSGLFKWNLTERRN